jgi:hypothetical protein
MGADLQAACAFRGDNNQQPIANIQGTPPFDSGLRPSLRVALSDRPVVSERSESNQSNPRESKGQIPTTKDGRAGAPARAVDHPRRGARRRLGRHSPRRPRPAGKGSGSPRSCASAFIRVHQSKTWASEVEVVMGERRSTRMAGPAGLARFDSLRSLTAGRRLRRCAPSRPAGRPSRPLRVRSVRPAVRRPGRATGATDIRLMCADAEVGQDSTSESAGIRRGGDSAGNIQ